jgi:DNA-binding LacI/PurR family transcriptional regulator
MARGAIGVIRSVGLRVSEDVAVIGFDDSALASASDLSSVRQPMFQQGEMLAGLIVDELAGKHPEALTILPTELVLRGSAPAV